MSSHCFHLGTRFSHFLPLCSGSPDSASTISRAVSAESEVPNHEFPLLSLMYPFFTFPSSCSGSPDRASTISSAVSAESEGRLTPGFNRQLGSFPFLIPLHFLPLSTLKLYFLPILPSDSGHLISLAVMLLTDSANTIYSACEDAKQAAYTFALILIPIPSSLSS